MTQSIPLIRASALVPMLKWMSARGLNTGSALSAVDLSWYPAGNPMQPVPLLNCIEFLRNLARARGADIPLRVVGDTGLFDLAMLVRIALGTRTPREALDRIERAMPLHCSHETLSVWEEDGSCVVRDSWSMKVDAEARHLVDQYLAAMLGVLFGLTVAGPNFAARVSMVPHPRFGFDHLDRFRDRFEFVETDGPVEMRVALDHAEGRFRRVARDRMNGAAAGAWEPLSGDGSLSHSIRALLPGMLAHGLPGIDRIAGYAGTSRRTFQRRLAREDASFSDILDTVRLEMLDRLADSPELTLAEISDRLGFARQSTLTRAVRRWMGQTPSQVRFRSKAGALAKPAAQHQSGIEAP